MDGLNRVDFKELTYVQIIPKYLSNSIILNFIVNHVIKFNFSGDVTDLYSIAIVFFTNNKS